MKASAFEDVLGDALADVEVKREYEALEEEFAIASEVIRLRTQHHMTQRELAERVGTSQPAIARLESGNYRNLSLSFLRRIATALDAVAEVHIRPRRET